MCMYSFVILPCVDSYNHFYAYLILANLDLFPDWKRCEYFQHKNLWKGRYAKLVLFSLIVPFRPRRLPRSQILFLVSINDDHTFLTTACTLDLFLSPSLPAASIPVLLPSHSQKCTGSCLFMGQCNTFYFLRLCGMF